MKKHYKEYEVDPYYVSIIGIKTNYDELWFGSTNSKLIAIIQENIIL